MYTDQTQQASTEMCLAPWMPARPAPVPLPPYLGRSARSLLRWQWGLFAFAFGLEWK